MFYTFLESDIYCYFGPMIFKKIIIIFLQVDRMLCKKLIFNLQQKRKTPTDACNQISICCVSQGISKVLKQGQSRECIFIVSHCPWSHIKLNKVIPNIYQYILFGWKQWTERRIILVCSSWFWLFYRPHQVLSYAILKCL